MMVNTVLGHLRHQEGVDWSAVTRLILVADCGPHFRSSENIAHFCVRLPKLLQVPVEVCWLGEQHGKSGVDRCFGWCNTWITDYICRSPIHNLKDLMTCFQQGSAKMSKDDPQSAPVLILPFKAEKERPTTRFYFTCAELKVSRTYSLMGTPTPYSASGVSVLNKTFSDLTGGETLAWTLSEITAAEPLPWRVGYYDKPRSWEQHGVQLGKDNSITRRHAAQKHKRRQNMPGRKATFLESCSSKALSLRKAAAKKKRKHKLLREAEGASTSSSSSSSSSSGSSASSSSENLT